MDTSPVSASAAEDTLRAELLAQLNHERAARGIGPVRHDSNIGAAADQWARVLVSAQNLRHSSDGRAEIVARGYRTGQITTAWMNSPSHRSLMVDPNLGIAGVGVACDSRGQMWAAIQFVRLDTRRGTLSSSPASPVATRSGWGSGCGDSPVSNQVQRLYQAYFRRASDASGLFYWIGKLATGSSLSNVSSSFAASPEFQTMYGRLSDRDFVRRVYLNVMGREPDASGYAYWVGQMNSGMTRGSVMIGFSESAEFRAKTGLG